jgi:cytochrome c-type biogenesis protein CcmF
MEKIQYIGETLLPGQLGQLGVLLGFVGALLSMIAYWFATQRRESTEFESWRNIGRYAFLTHGLGIFMVIGALLYAMINQLYEYQYVQAHVSEELPMKFIFSALWEGQEGSFLLWMFWHVLLGMVLLFNGKSWETSTLTVIAAIQAVLGTMLLGIYVGWGDEPAKFGSNPMLLLRQAIDAPIFAQADYVKLINGNGLNPALQNYWMTIHPPTLFLGFAATAVPFAFAIAGLWTRRHTEWLRPALPWALFCGSILGIGILMGSAWAYEALNFGGYWAWDPVENTSLVPWLLIIAGIHTNLVAKATGHSVRSSYIFYLLGFLLVVYSTFLTRSGVLGDTSVHAFTEMGLENQLVLFISVFTLSAFGLMIWRWRGIPNPKTEEATGSKEFWMFIGTLVLLFSAVLITGSTSLPVYNKVMQVFDPTYEGKVITEPVEHFNKYQLWIAVFIGIFSGFAQFLRFRENNWSKNAAHFAVHTGAALGIAAILTYATSRLIELPTWQYALLTFSGYFTIVSNVDYLLNYLRGNLKQAGSALSHIGFGLMLVGIMASGVNRKIISSNAFLMDGLIAGADEEMAKKNITLFRNVPTLMQDYMVTYVGDTLEHYTRTYTVNYQRKNRQGKVVEDFNLYPTILYDKSFTKIATSNPDTRHYWLKDVFTHISALPEVEQNFELKKQREEELKYKALEITRGQTQVLYDTLRVENQDTVFTRNFQISLESVSRNPLHHDYKPEPGDLAFSAKLRVKRSDDDSVYYANPAIVLRGQLIYTYPDQIDDLSCKFKINENGLEKIFVFDNQLQYETLNLRQGEEGQWQDLKVKFTGFNKVPEHPDYQRKEGDLAVGAMLDISAANGKVYHAEPIFLIRDQQPLSVKVDVPELDLHLRFPLLDPGKETIQLMLAKATASSTIPLEVATDALPANYIVLEAMEFPGINVFWLGSLLMMFGLGFSIWHRAGRRGSVETGTAL